MRHRAVVGPAAIALLAAVIVLAAPLAGARAGVVGASEPTRAATASRPSEQSVFPAGSAAAYGSTGTTLLNHPIIDIVAGPSGGGYWQLGADGGVFAFGAAPFLGSTGSLPLNKPVVAMTATSTGAGYWFVASDGGIFAFGDAGFHGSAADLPLNRPIVGMSPTRTGNGYLLVASDGGVFALGDATFSGSLGGQGVEFPIVALSPTPSGNGYWLVDVRGQVHGFGDAFVFGYHAGPHAVDIQSTPTGQGYWVLYSDGLIESFGDAPEFSLAISLGAGQRAVGVASTPDGTGVWVSTTGRARPPDTSKAEGAHAFLRVDRAGRPGRWNPCAAIPWYLNLTHLPPEGDQLVAEGFDYVGAVTGLRFEYAGTTSEPGLPRIEGAITVGWLPGLPAAGLAFTDIRSAPNGPRIVAAGIALDADSNRPVKWGGESWGAVLLHELGHTVGLAHVNDPFQIMRDEAKLVVDGFGPGDLAGLHRLGAAAGCL